MDEPVVEQKYIDFIEDLIQQVSPLLPEDVNALQENYLITNMRKSAMLMAGSMKDNDAFGDLDFEKQCFYIQVLTEWSFHKEIDLFRSGIPAKYWKEVMQRIWYTMWEVMYACEKNDAPESSTLVLVERFVNRTYNEAVEELKEKAVIDIETETNAKEQSNIEKMALEYKKNEKLRSLFINIFKLGTLFIVTTIVVSFLIIKFQYAGMIPILTFIILYNFINIKRN